MQNEKSFKLLGELVTNTNSLIIGDPAHFIHIDYDSPMILGESWEEFTKNVEELTTKGVSQLPFDDGEKGLGVLIPSKELAQVIGVYKDNELIEIRIKIK
jgi:hypothetical protein